MKSRGLVGLFTTPPTFNIAGWEGEGELVYILTSERHCGDRSYVFLKVVSTDLEIPHSSMLQVGHGIHEWRGMGCL